MKNLLNKRGSFTVFLTMIFAAVMIMIWAVIWASGQVQISCMTKDFGRRWGRSILAEFDINLKERYGLFGFYGNEVLVGEKLDFYSDYSFGSKDYISCGQAECSLEGYSLAEPANMEKQIKEIVLYGIKPKPLFLPDMQPETDELPAGAKEEHSIAADRYINSRWIIEALPSEGNQTSVGINSLIEKVKEGLSISSLTENAAEDIYIFRFFKDYMDSRELGETYFNNEIEYIISGRLSDNKAKEKVYNNIIALRNAMNLAYLYGCDEKRNAAMAAAEIISPGPAAIAVQLIILETWAFMEAKNDLKLLYDNKPVPIMKSDRSWALSLENVLSTMSISEEQISTGEIQQEADRNGYIKPPAEEGIDYENYLKILTGALPREIKILRIMDLIQINMKYLYCDYFLLEDYYTGLEFSLEVNGRTYEFEEKYQK